MTRFTYDQFAKQYLEELLTPLGEVNISREVTGEVQQVDVWFAPTSQSKLQPQVLGLLGRFVSSICLLEPFSDSPNNTEIRNCLLKLFLIHSELHYRATSDNTLLQETELPYLWILAPSASSTLLNNLGGRLDQPHWPSGVYFLANILRTALVAINELPRTEDTIWLRILGRKQIQQQAIHDLVALPKKHPLRSNALEIISSWWMNIESQGDITDEQRELIMNLSPAYLQWREETLQE